MRPFFVSMTPPHQIVFETRIGAAWAVNMRHCFDIEPDGPDASVLHQHFEAEGLLVSLLWRQLRAGMLQFEALGEDLVAHLAGG